MVRVCACACAYACATASACVRACVCACVRARACALGVRRSLKLAPLLHPCSLLSCGHCIRCVAGLPVAHRAVEPHGTLLDDVCAAQPMLRLSEALRRLADRRSCWCRSGAASFDARTRKCQPHAATKAITSFFTKGNAPPSARKTACCLVLLRLSRQSSRGMQPLRAMRLPLSPPLHTQPVGCGSPLHGTYRECAISFGAKAAVRS